MYFKLDAPDVRAIYQDQEGTLWIGALMEEHPGGLYRFRDGKLDQIPGVSDVNRLSRTGTVGSGWAASKSSSICAAGKPSATTRSKVCLTAASIST